MTDKIPAYVTARKALAELLGCHVQTLAKWEQLEGAPVHSPKGYDVKKWLDFAADISKRSKVEKSSRKVEMEMEKLSEVVRGLKLRNDEDDKKLIRIDSVKETQTVLVSELNGLIRNIEDGLPQALLGLGIAEQRIVIQKEFDRMREKINKGL